MGGRATDSLRPVPPLASAHTARKGSRNSYERYERRGACSLADDCAGGRSVDPPRRPALRIRWSCVHRRRATTEHHGQIEPRCAFGSRLARGLRTSTERLSQAARRMPPCCHGRPCDASNIGAPRDKCTQPHTFTLNSRRLGPHELTDRAHDHFGAPRPRLFASSKHHSWFTSPLGSSSKSQYATLACVLALDTHCAPARATPKCARLQNKTSRYGATVATRCNAFGSTILQRRVATARTYMPSASSQPTTARYPA